VGRGVLIDYERWAGKRSKDVKPLESRGITVDELEQIVKEKGFDIRPGDILFVRTGFTKAYSALSADQRKALTVRESPSDFLGVSPTKETLRWIWESGFSAVAGDAPAFEQGPTAGPHTAPGNLWKGESWEDELQGGGLLHQWLLAGWGCPIGEMFDLEKLAETCERLGRWSFFVSSVPLKVPGGVASPPNAVAIF
jgi:kynurenine formamidase